MVKNSYEVNILGNKQISPSELQKLGLEVANSYNKKAMVKAQKMEDNGELSKMLFGNNPHFYLNPTERLLMGEYVKEKDVVATVFAGGDFALDSVYHGAKEVVGFDINQFQYPVGATKVKAINLLDYYDYFSFFSYPYGTNYMNPEIYRSLKEKEPQFKFFKFWDPIIEQYRKDLKKLEKDETYKMLVDIFSKKDKGNNLIANLLPKNVNILTPFSYGMTCGFMEETGADIIKLSNLIIGAAGDKTKNSYLENEQSYEEAKERLKTSNISFIKSDLLTLRRQLMLSKYLNNFNGFDTLYLSNIPEYINGNCFADSLDKQLMPLIKENGQIVYCCQSKDLDVLDGKKNPELFFDSKIQTINDLQEKNDVTALNLLKNKYDISYTSIDALCKLNGNGTEDIYVRVKRKNK